MANKILLADDSVTIQKVVELTFPGEDFEVTCVGNGAQALEVARAIRPDVVLLDIVLPGEDGYHICQVLKSDPDLQRTPVLLLSGTFEPFDEHRAAQCGAAGHLTKPFESHVLISKVTELLGDARDAPPPETTPNGPNPSPPFGVDCVRRKLPTPPAPPPAFPVAPSSGWFVVFRVVTPLESSPPRSSTPWTTIEFFAVTKNGATPTIRRVPPGRMSRLSTTTGPAAVL